MFCIFSKECKGRNFLHEISTVSHKFKAPSAQVFNAILDPEYLEICYPWLQRGLRISLPTRSRSRLRPRCLVLRGPFPIAVDIANKQAHQLRWSTGSDWSKEGSVNRGVQDQRSCDEAEGTLLTYDAKADLAGVIPIADNPIGQPIVKASLNSFFKNLDKALEHLSSKQIFCTRKSALYHS